MADVKYGADVLRLLLGDEEFGGGQGGVLSWYELRRDGLHFAPKPGVMTLEADAISGVDEHRRLIGPLLPIPFTWRELIEFDDMSRILSERLECGNEADESPRISEGAVHIDPPEPVSETEANIERLRALNPAAGMLARAVLDHVSGVDPRSRPDGPSDADSAVDGDGLPAQVKRREKATTIVDDNIIAELRTRDVDPMKMPSAPLGNKRWTLREEIGIAVGITPTSTKKAFTRLRKDGRMRTA